MTPRAASSFHSAGARPLYDQVSLVDNVLCCGVTGANEVSGGLHEVGSRSLEESPQGSVARTSGRSATTENGHRAGEKRQIRPASHRRPGRSGALVSSRGESGKSAEIS